MSRSPSSSFRLELLLGWNDKSFLFLWEMVMVVVVMHKGRSWENLALSAHYLCRMWTKLNVSIELCKTFFNPLFLAPRLFSLIIGYEWREKMTVKASFFLSSCVCSLIFFLLKHARSQRASSIEMMILWLKKYSLKSSVREMSMKKRVERIFLHIL